MNDIRVVLLAFSSRGAHRRSVLADLVDQVEKVAVGVGSVVCPDEVTRRKMRDGGVDALDGDFTKVNVGADGWCVGLVQSDMMMSEDKGQNVLESETGYASRGHASSESRHAQQVMGCP